MTRHWQSSERNSCWHHAILGFMALVLAATVTTAQAEAKGCIKGAVVGAIAGHYAGHHGLLGAAAGCIIGRHEASKPRGTAQSSH